MGHGLGGVGVENWVPQVVQMGRSRGSISLSLVMVEALIIFFCGYLANVRDTM